MGERDSPVDRMRRRGGGLMFKKWKETFRPESSFKVFLMSILFVGIGYGIYKGILDNYLAEVVGIGEFGRGAVEFFREIPGLLLVLVLALLFMLSAETLYKIGALIMIGGLGLIAAVPPGKVLVTLAICVHSLGEHMQLGMKSTLAMQYARPGKAGEALGDLESVNHVGTLVGYAAVILTFSLFSGKELFRAAFIAALVLYAVSTFFSFRMRGSSETDKTASRFYFNRKFTKYYMLEVFYGARKQVFITFGPYLLILFYGADTATVSLLMAISAIACFVFAPLIGKVIDRLGYKTVMISDTLILVIVCFFYGFAHHLFPMPVAFIVCCVNYILDSVISLASMASSVYVRDISDSPEETRATISTGISVNHLITVFIALFGGWVWQKLGIETLFVLSAVLGLCNSAYAATIKTKKKSTGAGA